MKITKFDATAIIMGRERVISYDGTRLCVEASIGEVEGIVRVFEALVPAGQAAAAETPAPAPSAASNNVPTAPEPEPVREVPKTKVTRKVSVQPVAPPVEEVKVETPTTPVTELAEDPHPGIDQPYEEPVKASVTVVSPSGEKTPVVGAVKYTCDDEDTVTITGFNTMRKVLDYLRGKYKFEDVDQFVGACETVMDTASPVPPLLERVGRDNLRGRIETALAASRGA